MGSGPVLLRNPLDPRMFTTGVCCGKKAGLFNITVCNHTVYLVVPNRDFLSTLLTFANCFILVHRMGSKRSLNAIPRYMYSFVVPNRDL